MSEPTATKEKIRNYNESFIMLGVVYVDSNPMCLECCAILTNDSMKKSKQPSSVGKDGNFLYNKKEGQPVKLFDFVKNMKTAKAKTLKPRFMVRSLSSLLY